MGSESESCRAEQKGANEISKCDTRETKRGAAEWDGMELD